jgi:hypothetical protein
VPNCDILHRPKIRTGSGTLNCNGITTRGG